MFGNVNQYLWDVCEMHVMYMYHQLVYERVAATCTSKQRKEVLKMSYDARRVKMINEEAERDICYVHIRQKKESRQHCDVRCRNGYK